MVGCPAVRPSVIAFLACLACAAPAAAAETTTVVPGAPGPGPSKYDKVFVTKFGPKSAKRVLVLMPGYYGGAGDFTLDARELVKRVPGLQVWAVDRRSEALEDTSRFKDALAGRISVQQALDYYLGWLTNPAQQPRFQPLDQAQFGFAKQWGVSLALQDVRRVVLRARRQGKRVILGGHSLGASMTAAYASWDFGGHPGYKDIDGLVLIDGGLLGSFSTPDLAATKKAIAQLDVNGPFVDLLGLKLPWAAGVFAEVGALAALKEPTAPSAVQSFPLLPPEFKPPIPATNRGAFGYAFDATTSPKALSLIHVQGGKLGPTGDWVDGEVSPIARVAQTFAQEPANATEWYFPAKLSIDVDAVNALTRNAQTDYLKLRPWHRRDVDLPLYAVQTDLTGGHVLRGAKRFIAGSKVPRSKSVLVDASSDESHLDPLTAAPDRNRFLKTVVPFLRALRRAT
jgi:pimeloyl-ACP methyl ester carboxylesterase